MRDRSRGGPSENDPKSPRLTPEELAALDPQALHQELQDMERRLEAAYQQLDHAHQQNERLVAALSAAKEQLAALRAEVDKLA
ncbi:MAG: hypothetical protein ACM362_13840, partial [Candidatus Methylomirabilota bacterium]